MIANIMMAASAAIIFLLGIAHFILTFWSSRLDPRDESLKAAMSTVAPVITRQTTIWRMWIGFNASHSMGILLFGLVYGYLALAHGEFLFQSTFLQVIGLVMLAGFVALAKLYWFTKLFFGASLSFILFLASVIIARISGSP